MDAGKLSTHQVPIHSGFRRLESQVYSVNYGSDYGTVLKLWLADQHGGVDCQQPELMLTAFSKLDRDVIADLFEHIAAEVRTGWTGSMIDGTDGGGIEKHDAEGRQLWCFPDGSWICTDPRTTAQHAEAAVLRAAGKPGMPALGVAPSVGV